MNFKSANPKIALGLLLGAKASMLLLSNPALAAISAPEAYTARQSAIEVEVVDTNQTASEQPVFVANNDYDAAPSRRPAQDYSADSGRRSRVFRR